MCPGNSNGVNMPGPVGTQPLQKGTGYGKGYRSHLPVPFVKGQPVDYLTMTVDQLKKFINFCYVSNFKKDLPDKASSRDPPPKWWPGQVQFDKNLCLRNKGRKHARDLHKQLLCKVVLELYKSYGVLSLLALGSDLADSSERHKYTLELGETWTIQEEQGARIRFFVDVVTRTYDVTSRERTVLSGKEDCENEEVRRQLKEKSNGRQTQVNKRKPLATKRKLSFDDSAPNKCQGESKEDESGFEHGCKYCRKRFKFQEFCEDHEKECPKGPRKSLSQEGFMNALGLLGPSQAKTDTALSHPSAEPPLHVGRTLRKLPKRNQLLSMLRNNPLPLSSGIGKKLISELGDKVEHRYPPAYEPFCRPKSGLKKIAEPKIQTVTKRMILKDGNNPHVYSYGRRQRVVRNQELVIGLSQRSWKLLNACKKARLCLTKVKQNTKKILVPSSLVKTSYLQRAFRGAIDYPQVQLVDIMKFPSDDVEKLLIQSKLRETKS